MNHLIFSYGAWGHWKRNRDTNGSSIFCMREPYHLFNDVIHLIIWYFTGSCPQKDDRKVSIYQSSDNFYVLSFWGYYKICQKPIHLRLNYPPKLIPLNYPIQCISMPYSWCAQDNYRVVGSPLLRTATDMHKIAQTYTLRYLILRISHIIFPWSCPTHLHTVS